MSDVPRLAALHPYPSYKPSGVEWLGDPIHWEVRRQIRWNRNRLVEAQCC